MTDLPLTNKMINRLKSVERRRVVDNAVREARGRRVVVDVSFGRTGTMAEAQAVVGRLGVVAWAPGVGSGEVLTITDVPGLRDHAISLTRVHRITFVDPDAEPRLKDHNDTWYAPGKVIAGPPRLGLA